MSLRATFVLGSLLSLALTSCADSRSVPPTADAKAAPISATVSPGQEEPGNDGDSTVQTARRPSHRPFGMKQAGLSPEEEADITAIVGTWGMPTVDPAWQQGPALVIARAGYVLLSSTVDKVPYWVEERVRKEAVTGNLPRRNPFAPDPKIPVGKRAELIDFKGSGYDRGHMAPAGDQTVDQQLKDETFFLSNMVPQAPLNNQRIWAALEDKVRGWAIERGEVWVVTGPLFYDPKEDDPQTADGVIDYQTIGPHAVAVPTHLYKIVIGKSPTSSAWEAFAVVLENRQYTGDVDKNLSSNLRSIRWIEDHSGINFFPDMDPAQQDTLENATGTLWAP